VHQLPWSHSLRSLIDPKSTIFRSNILRHVDPAIRILPNNLSTAFTVSWPRGGERIPHLHDLSRYSRHQAKVDPDSPVNERRIAMTTCPQCHAAERISKEYNSRTQQFNPIMTVFTVCLIKVEIPFLPIVPVATGFMTFVPPPIPNQ